MASLAIQTTKYFILSIALLCSLSTFAQADGVVDRLRLSAQNGDITLVEFADSLLALAEVNHGAIENPEVLMLRFPGFVDIIGPRLVERVRKHVAEDKRDEISQLSFLADRMFGAGSKYTEKIARAVSLNKKYEALVSRGTVDTAAAFRAELASEEEKKVYEPKLEAFLIRTIARSSNKAAPFRGIENLTALGKISKPPELSAAVKELLQILVKNAKQNKVNWTNSTLKKVRVAKFLDDLTKKDPEFLDLRIAIEEQKAKHFASTNSTEKVLEAIQWITARRADPNDQNSNLRREILFSLSGEQGAPLAEVLIPELLRVNALSFGEKTDLYFKGYYGKGTLLTIIILIFVLLLGSAGALFVIGKKVPELSPDSIFGRMQEAKRNRMIKKNEKRGVGYTSVVEEDDQYSKLLAEFGLDDTATDSDIKKAYRQMVKELHPDAHGAAGVVTNEDGTTDHSFEELKKNYNRLLEMRKSFFSR